MSISNAYPLVSIILATYNGETFLRQQLDSLSAQTYTNIEIIAIDDGSKDATLEILHEYAAAKKNVKVFQNENNLGFIKNFEKGCSLSSGDLISLCDQDDFWHPDKIKNMVENIGEYPLIYCDSLVCDENLNPTGKKLSDLVVCKNFHSCLEYAVYARIYGNTLLFTKTLFLKTAPFLTLIPHDWWLAYNATLCGGIKFLPEALVSYRQHPANVYGVIGRRREKKKFLFFFPARTRTRKEKRDDRISVQAQARERVKIFYDTCPDDLVKEKKVLKQLVKSYEDFSLPNDFLRMYLFFRYRKLLLATKKRSLLRNYLFCFKMFAFIK
jgi:glycosyltransferase involved in cell wall biosynthesis